MGYSDELIKIQDRLDALLAALTKRQVTAVLNQLSLYIQKKGLFSTEPVSAVQWIKAEYIVGNDYNPNNVALPELKLLTHSMLTDGFTQPLVVRALNKNQFELIDGYHRHSISQKNMALKKRLDGYVPVVVISYEAGRKDHIAATIRHNRARGRHQIQAMSALVQELVHLGWDEKRIAEELGMEADEVLRLRQINGLTEMFSRRTYSEAWTVR